MTSVCLTQVKNRTKQRSNLESGDAFQAGGTLTERGREKQREGKKREREKQQARERLRESEWLAV